jgi:hypothetical protein
LKSNGHSASPFTKPFFIGNIVPQHSITHHETQKSNAYLTSKDKPIERAVQVLILIPQGD